MTSAPSAAADHSSTEHHPVRDMHGSQHLFDPADACGGQTWGVVPALLAP